MEGVFAQAWPPPCRFFLLLPLPPSPFQADPLECGGSLSLLARAYETHARGSPRWGTLRYSSGHLWSSLDGASSLSETLLVFHVNQVNQLLSSTHFSTTPFFPNLILIFLIKLSFPCLSISPSNHPGSTGAGPWQISPSISLISISYL